MKTIKMVSYYGESFLEIGEFMLLQEWLGTAVDSLLFLVCLFLLGSGVYLTVKMRFVQFQVFSLLRRKKQKTFSHKDIQKEHTISPVRALFTAMSTTLGISTIVGPVIAIKLG